jgi:hypothetical protein
MIQPVLSEYIAAHPDWAEPRKQKMIDGLRALQKIAAGGVKPVTYKEFADRVQPKMAALAATAILEDIGAFCNEAGWPNVTAFVVARTTGEPSDGFTKNSTLTPVAAREHAWLAYAAYKNGILVDVADADATAEASA